MSKTSHLHIRLTTSEYQQIATKAQTVGLSKSEFIRCAALRRALRPQKLEQELYLTLSEIYQRLSQINGDLAQITEPCHQSKPSEVIMVKRETLENYQQQLQQANQQIQTLISQLIA